MKIFYLLIASCMILFTFSCKNENSSDIPGFKKYTSDSLGFSIDYPENFEPKEYFNQYVPIAFFEEVKDSTNDFYPENVLFNIETIPAEVTFGDFVKASKTQLKLMIPELTIYDEDSLNIDGVPTAVYKFYRPKTDNIHFVAKMYVMFQKNRALNVSCTADANVFDAYEPIFDKVIGSTKFKK